MELQIINKKQNKMKRLIVLLLIMIGTAGAFGIYFYNKPRSGVSGMKPVAIEDARLLYEEYNTNENAANAKYLGKAIEVFGIVRSVETDDKGKMNVMIETGNEMGAVNCQFEKQDEMPVVNKGSSVLIKGFCSGLLLDVVMVDCELVSQK